MEAERVRQVVLETLGRIAPETRSLALDAQLALREQVDLDSMDWLHFLLALHEKLHVDIPESDYRRLTTLDRLVSYLTERV